MKNIKEFNEELGNAYSTSNYNGTWIPCIKMLRKRGYNDLQVEAIIRSKWTRWAADGSDKRYGRVNSADLARFLNTMKNLDVEIAALVRWTFDDVQSI